METTSSTDWPQVIILIITAVILAWTALITLKSQKLQKERALFERNLEKFKASPNILITLAEITHFPGTLTKNFDFTYQNSGNTPAYNLKIVFKYWMGTDNPTSRNPTWPVTSRIIPKAFPNELSIVALTIPEMLSSYGTLYFKITIKYDQIFMEERLPFCRNFYYVTKNTLLEHAIQKITKTPIPVASIEEVDIIEHLDNEKTSD